MVAKKKSGLGRGIGALIPQSVSTEERPVDVFFSSDGPASTKSGSKQSDAEKKTAAKRATVANKGQTGESETELQEVPGAALTTLEVANIVPNRSQPRREFDEDAMEELTHSVREFGVFQPIVVRQIEPKPKSGEPNYELIMGERRLRASVRAGLETIPAIIRGTEDEHMLRDALLENLHRAQLNPLEEASAYQQLMQDFGTTQEELAQKIGRSRPQISNTIRLLKLPEVVQTKVAAGVLSAGHARAILSLDGDSEMMERFAEKIVNEGLSVRAAEEVATKQPKRKLPRPRPGGVQGQLNEIADRLGDRFDTRVHVKLGTKKGQVVIDFATIDDLKRILAELGDSGFN